MTDLLEKAAATARRLLPDVQDKMARALLALAGHEHPADQLTPDEETEQDEADAAEAITRPKQRCAPSEPRNRC